MADPFATALGVLMGAPGTVAVIYNGGTSPIRVIRHQPSELAHSPLGSMVLDGNSFVIAVADVAMPARGDTMLVNGETLTVLADPMLDAEGISWTVQAA